MHSILRLFRPVPATVQASILDPKSGPKLETWRVGVEVPKASVRKYGEDGWVFVLVAYQEGERVQMIVPRRVFDQAQKQFREIERSAGRYDERPKYGLPIE